MDAWGKFQEPDRFHRLEHHCADVAACFEALLNDPVLWARFEQASDPGGFSHTTAARLTVLAFLHDFGKLNAGFQFKVRDRNEFPGAPQKTNHIGVALQATDDICQALGLFEIYRAWGPAVDSLLLAALSHHGRPPRKPTMTGGGPQDIWTPFVGYDPAATAALLNERIRSWFPEAFVEGPTLPDTPALAHLFAGVVALADQIGSDEELFEFEPNDDVRYIDRARRIADDTVKRKGFRRRDWPTAAAAADFQTLFNHDEPRPLQRVVAAAPLECPLLILESETGSGKTEAAILRFAALWRTAFVDGLYFAVPTRAAAKQLHVRVSRALERLFPANQHIETVLAVPGYLVVGETKGRRTGQFEVFWEDNPDEATRCARWSAESARKYLSATAAVGTIDQVLLSGLKVKWAHFRAAALARSLLVIDEVHANDAYMTEVLRTVLHGHLELGGHALLMSATLGAAAHTRLATRRARTHPMPPTEAQAVPYPALTVVDANGELRVHKISGNQSNKRVSMNLESIIGAPEEIAGRALDAARQGAKVLVIRNTVTSAQHIFDATLDQGGEPLVFEVEQTPTLHHGRFAAEDRRRLDVRVEAVLGQNREPGGVVVVGTQTLEQSLDIDADLLITDICPVDVLLQRIGRLHRHPRTDRPERFENASCVVAIPEEGLESGINGGLLRYGLGVSNHGGGVYRNLLCMEATRRLIADHPTWTIPDMNRMLVERATHPEVLNDLAQAFGGLWLSHEQKTFGLAAAEEGVARRHTFTRTEEFNEEFSFADVDENVRTRLGEDGPRIELADTVPGPFGKPVQTFNLPAHMFREGLPGKEDIDNARGEPTQSGVTLHIGSYTFNYDRTGVRSS